MKYLYIKPKKENKYRNKKIIINGIKYDSKKEAKRHQELLLLEKMGEISNLELQKTFELIKTNKQVKPTLKKCLYIADFYYYDKKYKKFIVEDIKSDITRTTAYQIKKKIFCEKYKDLIFFENGKKKIYYLPNK